jgi:hypothetical protein
MAIDKETPKGAPFVFPPIRAGASMGWHSESARNHRAQTGWLEGMKGKVDSLILPEVVKAFGQDRTHQDLRTLADFAISRKPNLQSSLPRFFTSLGELGADFVFRPPLSMDMVDRVFPAYGTKEVLTDFAPDFDPRSFLHFCLDQIGWRGVREGWAICVAEYDRARGDGGIFAWVPPDRFAALSDDGSIALPYAGALVDLSGTATTSTGADCLWFALSRDLEQFVAGQNNTGGPRGRDKVGKEVRAQKALGGLHHDRPKARLTKTDACVALEWVGFGKNAQNRIWDRGAPDEWKQSGRVAAGVERISIDELKQVLACKFN